MTTTRTSMLPRQSNVASPWQRRLATTASLAARRPPVRLCPPVRGHLGRPPSYALGRRLTKRGRLQGRECPQRRTSRGTTTKRTTTLPRLSNVASPWRRHLATTSSLAARRPPARLRPPVRRRPGRPPSYALGRCPTERGRSREQECPRGHISQWTTTTRTSTSPRPANVASP